MGHERQALMTFRTVLRDQNFGALQVGSYQADRLGHLFCSVGMLANRGLWEQVGPGFYDFIVLDEAHNYIGSQAAELALALADRLPPPEITHLFSPTLVRRHSVIAPSDNDRS